MSTKLHGASPLMNLPPTTDLRFAVVSTFWNKDVTSRLRDGAVETLRQRGVAADDIDQYEVPGAVELTFAASQLIETSQYDAIIVLGCVVRGDTPHFDYVCQSVTQGVTMLNADCDVPVIFGVLTVDKMEDAMERAGGKYGNKGSEAAEAAIVMANFARQAKDM